MTATQPGPTLLDPPDALERHLPDGIHDGIEPAIYHADQLCHEQTLSASIAHVLCARSPLHAWTAHPRLNPQYKPKTSDAFDLGTAAHALLLQGENACEVIDAKDYKTKVAREAKAAAYAAGKTPLLVGQWARVQEMVTAVKAQIATFDDGPPLLANGRPEQTLIWHEGGITCRSRLDWLTNDYAVVDDLKTTSASGHPQEWTRRLWSFGADVQCAMYKRAVRTLSGTDPIFRWIVAETEPPYAVSIIGLAPSALALADEKCEYAIAAWRDCLAAGQWPSYPPAVALAEMPGWAEDRWVEARVADGYLESTTTELKL